MPTYVPRCPDPSSPITHSLFTRRATYDLVRCPHLKYARTVAKATMPSCELRDFRTEPVKLDFRTFSGVGRSTACGCLSATSTTADVCDRRGERA
jgi:hypothetical protein